MTEIEKKALELVNEVARSRQQVTWDCIDRKFWLEEAICRAIEQHESFRQEVSDAMLVLQEYITGSELWKRGDRTFGVRLADGRDVIFDDRFIIAKPDPLVDALAELNYFDPNNSAKNLYAALAKRGLEIREKKDVR